MTQIELFPAACGVRLADLREWPRRYAIAFAFPPCTHLAVSGARWFRMKGIGGLTEALELVEACRRVCEWTRAPWMIENPVSTLASYWREPDFTFHPHQFGGWPGGEGDDYSKRTCLWTGGGFRLPQQRPIPEFRPLYIHNLPPSDERGDLRSITPPGFARAVFEANLGRGQRRLNYCSNGSFSENGHPETSSFLEPRDASGFASFKRRRAARIALLGAATALEGKP